MSAEFGDIEPDDAYVEDSVPDPEQVARRLHELRMEQGYETIDWDAQPDEVRLVAVAIIVRILDWLRREGSLR